MVVIFGKQEDFRGEKRQERGFCGVGDVLFLNLSTGHGAVLLL